MTVWESYTAIVDACCDAWNGLMRDAERIASLSVYPESYPYLTQLSQHEADGGQA